MPSDLSRSRLVRLLAGLSALPVEPMRQDPAERLGGWLGALDAVRLEAALQSLKGLTTSPGGQGGPVPSLADVHGAVRREREALKQAIEAPLPMHAASGHGAGWRAGAGSAAPAAAAPPRPAYAPFHKRHVDLQRQMDTKVGQLRAAVRRVLSQGPASLRQLAALDAALEQAMAARGDKLLAGVPVLLERRFEALNQDKGQGRGGDDARPPAAEGGPEAPQPPAWLPAFQREWQEVLLAELEVRLQPVMGLMEALGAEVRKNQ